MRLRVTNGGRATTETLTMHASARRAAVTTASSLASGMKSARSDRDAELRDGLRPRRSSAQQRLLMPRPSARSVLVPTAISHPRCPKLDMPSAASAKPAMAQPSVATSKRSIGALKRRFHGLGAATV
jgi:hypothetical protein